MFQNWAQIIDWLLNVRRVSLAVVIVLCVFYAWVRRPDWPIHPGQIRIPYAGWIVAVIVALVIAMFAYLISRDPLAPRV